MTFADLAEADRLPLTLTVEEAGELLGLSRSSAYRAAARGEIPTIRLGRRLVVPSAKLLALVGIEPSGRDTDEGADR
ncbi:MAG TPA: helix-turn-helix domain-containing protein [Nitriliruptorales bacterium]|nr:helix-turn-helix domain-containing protein [Nitriliruptorales bacterium]